MDIKDCWKLDIYCIVFVKTSGTHLNQFSTKIFIILISTSPDLQSSSQRVNRSRDTVWILFGLTKTKNKFIAQNRIVKNEYVDLRIRLICLSISHFQPATAKCWSLELIAPTTLIGQLEKIKQLSFSFLHIRIVLSTLLGPGLDFLNETKIISQESFPIFSKTFNINMNINEYVDWTNFILPISYILLQSG